MWQYALLVSCLHVTLTNGRPLATENFPLWEQLRPSELGAPPPSDLQNNVITFPQDTYNSGGHEDKHQKRGFSILSRWRPFSSLGRQRTPVSEFSRTPVLGPEDIISAETRAMLRPMGQPLRWG